MDLASSSSSSTTTSCLGVVQKSPCSVSYLRQAVPLRLHLLSTPISILSWQTSCHYSWRRSPRRPCQKPLWTLKAQDDDFETEEFVEADDDDRDDEEGEDMQDYETDYDISKAVEPEHQESDTFVSTQGEAAEHVVDHKINEEEFHKLSLQHCDFFIRKVLDPDNDVYDFREMYVTEPDTDIYAIPRVEGKLPQKVFLMKHYKNRRADNWNFVLDFEQIYVIDSKTKSISRAKVTLNVPGGADRDRSSEILVVNDDGATFRVIPESQRKTPDELVHEMEWKQTKADVDNYLRSFRDYHISNWF